MSRDTPTLDAVLENPRVWRGQSGRQTANGLPTGYPALDRCLSGGGWPDAALIEILTDAYGIGELELLMPALAALCAPPTSPDGQPDEEPGWITWIAPPFQPYPPALRDWHIDLERLLIVRPRDAGEILWSAEQALSSGTCAAVLLWPERFDDQAGRRLQLAAGKGSSRAFAFRPVSAQREPSAAALRLRLTPEANGTELAVVKNRGGRPAVLKRFFPPERSSPESL